MRRETLLVIGIVSVLATWIAWGAIDPIPLVEDETSYMLQSRIFASGRWTLPTPAVPEFFQQAHVLTIPAVASKYPPGHALLMSIGSLVGAPVLMPLLLTGLTGALLFMLVARIANQWVGLLAWLAWLGDPINLRFRSAYYSEVTTSAMWVLSWWALLEWRETRRTRWLLAVAAAIGWGAITRPLTMLAFAVPVGVVVIHDVVRHRLWRDFAAAFALGTLTLGIIPLWSAKTTGDWRLTPQALYTRDYLPFDKPGFGIDRTPPARRLSPVNNATYAGFYDEHVKHTPENLPRIVLDRLRAIAQQEWKGPRLALAPFALVGLFAMSAEVAFALVCSLALFLAYLSYGHWLHWTLYYFEATPILSVLTAFGIWRVITWARSRATTAAPLRRSTAPPLVAALLSAIAIYQVHDARAKRLDAQKREVAFRELLAEVPFRGAVVFVHYAPRIGPHDSIVANSPTLDTDRIWIVHDLGSRNAELMRHAGDRVPLAFYEESMSIEVDKSLLQAGSSATGAR